MKQPERKKAVIPENNDPLNLPNQSSNKYTQLTDKEALKILYSLIEADNARKHPDNPYPLRAKPYNVKKTGDLTKAVIKFIQLNGGQAERISSTGRYIDNSINSTNVMGQRVKIGSGHYIPSTSTNGTADVSGILRNAEGVVLSLKIEIKNLYSKDRISPAQIEYQKQVEAAGGVYLAVKTFSEFVQWHFANIGGSTHE
jgi:hypothetical protein